MVRRAGGSAFQSLGAEQIKVMKGFEGESQYLNFASAWSRALT